MFLKIIGKNKLITDLDLVQQYQKTGDNQYVGELFERYTHLVFGVCLKYLKNEALSKDAVIQIFEKLLKDLKQHQIENFKSWLHRVSKNHCLMYLRKQQSQLKHQEEYKKNTLSDVENVNFWHLDNEAEKKEKKLQELEAALQKLKKEQKQCIELFYLEEKSYQEITEITGFSLKEVKSHLQNGKRKLKIQLATFTFLALLISTLNLSLFDW
jgi:RNA polymerase sigma-70 factor (ECF subfamily)